MSRTAVVVVNYNNARDTALCVQSLLKLPELPVLVVVDNASTSGGIDEAVAPYPKAKVIYSPINVGFGRGNNLGIRWTLAHTNCEFVFLLNNDAMVDPDTIKVLEAALDEHPEAGISTPRIVLAEDPRVLWYGGGMVDWRKGAARTPGYLGPADSMQALEERNVSFASGCAMLIRRSVLERVKGFDPRFFMYEEDVELCLRVQEEGWSIRYVPQARVLHKGQGSSRGDWDTYIDMGSPYNPKLPFYLFHRTKNTLLTMYIHARGYRALLFGLFFLPILFRSCAQLVFYRRWDGIRAIARSIRAFVQEVRKPHMDWVRLHGEGSPQVGETPVRFSLVLATVGRSNEVGRFLDSLLDQTYQNLELILVDQNPDDRLKGLIAPYRGKLPILHLRSQKGLSKARNLGLKHISGDVVAFPDDDCQYPPDLLERVAHFLADHPEVDGLTGRIADDKAKYGHFDVDAGFINRFNVWSRATSISIFLRASSVQGLWFNEELGLGASTKSESGEEFDYLLRLLARRALIYYDPDVIAVHPPLTGTDPVAIRKQHIYSRGMGRVLRVHSYPIWLISYRMFRPLGGVLLALGKGQAAEVGYYWAVFRGRLSGYLKR